MVHNHSPLTDWTDPESVDLIGLDPGIADLVKELHTYPGVGTYASCSGLMSDHNGTKNEYPYIVVIIDDQFPVGVIVKLMQESRLRDWELSARVEDRGVYSLNFKYRPLHAGSFKLPKELKSQIETCWDIDWRIFDHVTDADVKNSWRKLRTLLRNTLGDQ